MAAPGLPPLRPPLLLALAVLLGLHGPTLTDGQLVALGGQTSASSMSDAAYVFNGSTWSTLATLAFPRASAAAVFYSGKLYFIGGKSLVGTRVSDVDVFTGGSAFEPSVSVLPTARMNHAAAVFNNAIVVTGGIFTEPTQSVIFSSFVAQALTWTNGPNLLNARFDHASALCINGTALAVAGGRNAVNPYMSQVEILYDLTQAWASGPSLNEARRNPAAAYFSGSIVVSGGQGVAGILATVEILRASVFEYLVPMKDSVLSHGMAVFRGSLFVVGGNVSGAYVSNVEVYQETNKAWAFNVSLPTPLTLHSLVSVSCSTGSFVSPKLECIKCPPGTFGADGVTCTPCPAGTFLTGSGATNASTCLSCPMGTYSLQSGSANCTGCTPGFFSTAVGASTAGVCKACAPGSFAGTNGSSACTGCEAGKISSGNGASSCASCEPGKYSFPSTNGTTCVDCAAGRFSPGGGSSCEPCPAGSFSLGGSSACQPCEPGSYTPFIGFDMCLLCDPGTANRLRNQSRCSDCPTGTTSIDLINCDTCDRGYYRTSSVCAICPSGTYSSGFNSSRCSLCPANTASLFPGASACQSCTAGTFSLEGASFCTQTLRAYLANDKTLSSFNVYLASVGFGSTVEAGKLTVIVPENEAFTGVDIRWLFDSPSQRLYTISTLISRELVPLNFQGDLIINSLSDEPILLQRNSSLDSVSVNSVAAVTDRIQFFDGSVVFRVSSVPPPRRLLTWKTCLENSNGFTLPSGGLVMGRFGTERDELFVCTSIVQDGSLRLRGEVVHVPSMQCKGGPGIFEDEFQNLVICTGSSPLRVDGPTVRECWRSKEASRLEYSPADLGSGVVLLTSASGRILVGPHPLRFDTIINCK